MNLAIVLSLFTFLCMVNHSDGVLFDKIPKSGGNGQVDSKENQDGSGNKDAAGEIKNDQTRVLKTLMSFCNNVVVFFANALPSCDSADILAPVLTMFVDQTYDACPNCRYINNVTGVVKGFVKNVHFLDLMTVDDNGDLLSRLSKDLPMIAKNSFADTGISEQMYNTYVEFNKHITAILLLNLIIGGNTDPLFVEFYKALSLVFKEHPEHEHVKETYKKIQLSLNSGKKDMWKALKDGIIRILKVPL